MHGLPSRATRGKAAEAPIGQGVTTSGRAGGSPESPKPAENRAARSVRVSHRLTPTQYAEEVEGRNTVRADDRAAVAHVSCIIRTRSALKLRNLRQIKKREGDQNFVKSFNEKQRWRSVAEA